MKNELPSNVNYLFRELEEEKYAKAILESEGNFDLIVIDGRDRVNCAKYAITKLKDDGVVIWDNSEREKYNESFELLAGMNFRRLVFFGMGPIAIQGWNTSVFYRTNNCFGL